LPGQLHCITEAIVEISRSEPPLVPTTTRPSLVNQRHSVDSGHASFETIRSREDQNSDTAEDLESPTTVLNLRTLIKRQTDLPIKQLVRGSESSLGVSTQSSGLYIQKPRGPMSQTSVTDFRGLNTTTMVRRQTMPEISTETTCAKGVQRTSIASSSISDFSLPDSTSVKSFSSIPV